MIVTVTVKVKVDAKAFAREVGIPVDEVAETIAGEFEGQGDALTWSVESAEVEQLKHQLTCEGCGHRWSVSAEFDLADCPKCSRDGLSERQQRVERDGCDSRYIVRSSINPCMIRCTDGEYHAEAQVGIGGWTPKVYKTRRGATKLAEQLGGTVAPA